MTERERWDGQSPSLPPFLHTSIKSLGNIPMEIRVEDKGIQENTHRIMQGLSGYGYHASLFSVFESTGDSEVDAWPADRGAVAMEEDDAESCSYDDLGSERSEEGSCYGEGEGGHAAEEEEEEGDGMRRDKAGGGGGFGLYKSWGSGESKGGGVDLMNEMERNKLFWEACLAS